MVIPFRPKISVASIAGSIDALERLGLMYAVGDSVAAMAYSEGRLTVDIDVMLQVGEVDLSRLVAEISSWQIYISPLEVILETDVPHAMPFNAIDGSIGTKVDFFVARPTGLDASAMSRRRRIPRCWLSSATNSI